MRVYKFWAEPTSLADAHQLAEQLRLAAEYRYELTAIENRARTAERQLDISDPAVAEVAAELDSLRQSLREITDTVVQEETRRVISEKKACLKAIRARRRSTDEAFGAALAVIRNQYSADVRAARGLFSERGLAWGTYLIVEEAHEQACRTTPIYDDVRATVRRDRGAIAVQIHKPRPLACADVVGGTDTRVRISGDAYALGPRVLGFRAAAVGTALNRSGNVRPKRLRQFQIRTASNGRAPVWTNFHILMHRELPPGQIKWVRVHQVRVGIRPRWDVQFVLAEDAPAATLRQADRIVGVDIGWRRLSHGMRVAYAVGSDGGHHELVLPDKVLRRAPKSADLRSIRDKHRDESRTRLLELRATLPPQSWFHTATAHMHVWYKIGRFVRLFNEWCLNRFVGDERAWEATRDWLKQDFHLLEWESHNLRRMRFEVRGRYAEWVARLCDRYDVIGIEKLNLRQLQNAKSTADNIPANLAHQRKMVVAPGELIECIKYIPIRRGVRVLEVAAADTTRSCSMCGALRPSSVDLMITCPDCGTAEDQDVTGGKNILARTTAAVVEGTLDMVGENKVKKLRARRTRKRIDPVPSVP